MFYVLCKRIVTFNKCSKKLERMSTSNCGTIFVHVDINRPTHMCISTLIYEPWIRALAERAEFLRLVIVVTLGYVFTQILVVTLGYVFTQILVVTLGFVFTQILVVTFGYVFTQIFVVTLGYVFTQIFVFWQIQTDATSNVFLSQLGSLKVYSC